jgi:hypothetical protein
MLSARGKNKNSGMSELDTLIICGINDSIKSGNTM